MTQEGIGGIAKEIGFGKDFFEVGLLRYTKGRKAREAQLMLEFSKILVNIDHPHGINHSRFLY